MTSNQWIRIVAFMLVFGFTANASAQRPSGAVPHINYDAWPKPTARETQVDKLRAEYEAAVQNYKARKIKTRAEYEKVVELYEKYLALYKSEWVPPKEYDHPYDGELTIVRIPVAGDRPFEMIEHCKGIKLGCAHRTPTGCKLYIVSDEYIKNRAPAYKKVGGLSYDMILRHEVGHCNGWPYDHPR